jgi:hypothetical protein
MLKTHRKKPRCGHGAPLTRSNLVATLEPGFWPSFEIPAGGRLDYVANRPAAALVYKRHQHTINLFLWRAPGSNSSPHTITIKGFNVVHWTQSHMAYWAVSDLNADELNEFAHDLEM